MARPLYKIFARKRNSDEKAKVVALVWPAREGSRFPDNLDVSIKTPDGQYCRFDPQWDLDMREVLKDPDGYFIDMRPVERAEARERPKAPQRKLPPGKARSSPRQAAPDPEPLEEDELPF